MDGTDFARAPVMVYGIDLLMCAIAWYVMQLVVFRVEGPDATVRQAVGHDVKGKLSPALYVAGILLTFVAPWLGIALYTVVAVMWLIPDRRFERVARAAEAA